jgi:hypothetical protein
MEGLVSVVRVHADQLWFGDASCVAASYCGHILSSFRVPYLAASATTEHEPSCKATKARATALAEG